MKPSQASIYREIERLLEFTIPMAERFPKSLPYRELGGRLILDLKESMDFVVLAFQAENRLERLECINAVVMRMLRKTKFLIAEEGKPAKAAVPKISNGEPKQLNIFDEKDLSR